MVLLFGMDVVRLWWVVFESCVGARRDRNAAQQGAFDDPTGGLRVVYNLDDEVDVRVVQNIVRRGGEQCRIGLDLAGLVRVADTDLQNFGMGVLRFAHHFVDALSADAASAQSRFAFSNTGLL